MNSVPATLPRRLLVRWLGEEAADSCDASCLQADGQPPVPGGPVVTIHMGRRCPHTLCPLQDFHLPVSPPDFFVTSLSVSFLLNPSPNRRPFPVAQRRPLPLAPPPGQAGRPAVWLTPLPTGRLPRPALQRPRLVCGPRRRPGQELVFVLSRWAQRTAHAARGEDRASRGTTGT